MNARTRSIPIATVCLMIGLGHAVLTGQSPGPAKNAAASAKSQKTGGQTPQSSSTAARQEEAKKAFLAGHSFYLWQTGKEPCDVTKVLMPGTNSPIVYGSCRVQYIVNPDYSPSPTSLVYRIRVPSYFDDLTGLQPPAMESESAAKVVSKSRSGDVLLGFKTNVNFSNNDRLSICILDTNGKQISNKIEIEGVLRPI